MAYNNKILLGRIIKVNGYKGAVTVKLEKIFCENIPQMEWVFLEIEGRPVPFFISSSEYSGADIIKIGFEGYDSIEKVSEFTGCRVFLTTGIPDKNQPDDIQNLIGYEVIMYGDRYLGSVTEVIQNPGQLLLNVSSPEKKNILIPFHEHFIISLDKKKKIIVMDIPDGLTEIN
jgi:16S rRNA processing protein RimM